MKTTKVKMGLLCLSLATFLVPQATAAQKKPKSAEETLQQEMDLIVQECKPTDEQQRSLKEKFKVKLDALEAWTKANTEKLKAAEDAARAARQGNDQEAKKKANSDLKSLLSEREQATAEADKAILAILSDDQKTSLSGAQLAQTTLQKYRKTNLTDEQTARIKAACRSAAKDMAGFTGDDRKDKQGRATVQKCLVWAIDNVILGPAQPATTAPVPAAPAPAAKLPGDAKQ
jgi:hypothetical protein